MAGHLVIAIDGPAAAGKGRLARRLAEHFGLNLLDSGLTYRAVAQRMLDDGLPLDDAQAAEAAARALDLTHLDRELLSAHAVGEAASRIAVFPGVRRALVEKQRAFAQQAPGAVLDGRDVGTVICPDADVKLFVTASARVRAGRRLAEIEARGGTGDLAKDRGEGWRCPGLRRDRAVLVPRHVGGERRDVVRRECAQEGGFPGAARTVQQH